MKKKNLGLIILAVAFVFIAHAQEKEIRNLSSFDKVSVGEAIKLIIEQGSSEKAIVEADGLALDKIVTEVKKGGKLNIHMAKGTFRSTSVTVYLTYKSLKEIDVNSAAKLESKSVVTGDELKMDVSSAGKAILEVDVDALYLDINSAGKLELSGKCNFNKIKVNSAGKLYAYDLQSKRVNADVNSAGKVEILVETELIAETNSGGKLTYKGKPDKVISDSDSGGRVKKY